MTQQIGWKTALGVGDKDADFGLKEVWEGTTKWVSSLVSNVETHIPGQLGNSQNTNCLSPSSSQLRNQHATQQ